MVHHRMSRTTGLTTLPGRYPGVLPTCVGRAESYGGGVVCTGHSLRWR